MQIQLAAESHVPCFQERVGTSIPGYMIPDRLPWRPRARPSATLHEIQVRPSMNDGTNLFLSSYKTQDAESRGTCGKMHQALTALGPAKENSPMQNLPFATEIIDLAQNVRQNLGLQNSYRHLEAARLISSG